MSLRSCPFDAARDFEKMWRLLQQETAHKQTHYVWHCSRLAESVIRACFHELAARGMERAYITGYKVPANALYEKLGPSAHKQWFHYELLEKK